MISLKNLFTSLLLVALTTAAPNPSTPVNVIEGTAVQVTWDLDTTGVWTSGSITLKSGDNFNMTDVAPVASGIDFTKTSSYTWTVPQVSPHALIYFLEFDQNGATDSPTWTTRFLIVGTDGATTAPEFSTQPNGGAKTPWGVGTLVSGAVPTGASTNTTTTANITTVVPTVVTPLPGATSTNTNVVTATANSQSNSSNNSNGNQVITTTGQGSGAGKLMISGLGLAGVASLMMLL